MIAGKKYKKQLRLARVGAYFGLGIVTGLLLLVAVARLTWHSKFYPGVRIGKTVVAGLTRAEAREKLTKIVAEYRLNADFNGNKWEIPTRVVSFDVEESLNEAYSYGRRLKIGDYLLLLIGKQTNYPLRVTVGEKAEPWLSQIATSVEIPPTPAEVVVVKQKIVVEQGVDGVIIDRAEWEKQLLTKAANLESEVIEIPVKVVKTSLSEEQLTILQKRGESLLPKKLTLTLDDEKSTLDGSELVGWLGVEDKDELLNVATINEYTQGLAESWNRQPQNAKFEFENGRVIEFVPSKDGVEIRKEESGIKIREGIIKLLNSEEEMVTIELPAIRNAPEITIDKVNELGIRERIGRGESYYTHSIPNRIYNVGLASSRLNSALIPPGETVSFNKLVGEVSGATGYQPAYVIANGRTELGDGGGLCQVSTTMFRAAMSAGLPIIERWGHAYRVSYYELDSKPGVDATVYAPSKDLKFVNDTPGHILVQTINDPKNLHLIIEIYGTNDGRVVSITTPKVWGITPPLPTVYQDDPSLPAGTLRQVDWSASGAKASFEYKVTRNGEILQNKTFSTSYRPWAAVYLRGTKE